jgi:bifunctional enzyme CysN/CysC
VAELTLRARRPVAFDVHGDLSATGRFVLVDRFDVAGGGIVLRDNYPRRTSDTLHKSTNIFWTTSKVTREQRTSRNGHPGCVIWLTGLSASGKSTIAADLERQLFNRGRHVYVLDGDKVRHGLCSDLAFSPEDRKDNIRRIGEVAKLMADAGVIVITAFISPYRADRRIVRTIMTEDEFIEVYVNAPVEVCEQRDPKGLYAKARSGQIKDFTGISAPYEPPENPELELRTDQTSVNECAARVMEYLDNLDRKARSTAAPRP